MSKSLYQYKFNPDQKHVLINSLNQAIISENFKYSEKDNAFVYGTGWLVPVRKIQYKICDNMLHICIWKAIAVIVPQLEVGNCSANNYVGCVVNSTTKNLIQRIISKANMSCPLTPIAICQTVDDTFLEKIGTYNQSSNHVSNEPHAGYANPNPNGYANPNPDGYANPNPNGYANPNPNGYANPNPNGYANPNPNGYANPNPNTYIPQCPNCHSQLLPGAAFCTNCGTKIV